MGRASGDNDFFLAVRHKTWARVRTSLAFRRKPGRGSRQEEAGRVQMREGAVKGPPADLSVCVRVCFPQLRTSGFIAARRLQWTRTP